MSSNNNNNNITNSNSKNESRNLSPSVENTTTTTTHEETVVVVERANETVLVGSGTITAGGTAVPNSEQQQQHQQQQEQEQRFPTDTSWEEPHSFDSEGGGTAWIQRGSRPSSRTAQQQQDHRKQLDTTTPTLIDEDDLDDEEQIHRVVRMRVGSGLYTKSTLFEPTPDEAAMIASMRRSAGLSTTEEERGGGGGVGNFTSSGPTPLQQQKRQAWHEQQYTSGIASASTGASAGASTDNVSSNSSSGTPLTSVRMGDTVGLSSSPTRQQQGTSHDSEKLHPKGPFTFAGPWGSGGGGASTTGGERTGAFSPSILRLTENIGYLLQEGDPEDDDTFTSPMDIPSVFRGAAASSSLVGTTNQTNQGDALINTQTTAERSTSTGSTHSKIVNAPASSYDWTGNYVYDSTSTSKRLETSRERREQQRPMQQGSGFVPYAAAAQQPTPRRSNEVFDLGKQSNFSSSRPALSEDRGESPQLLSFGGAFVPPNAGVAGFSRPMASGGAMQQQEKSGQVSRFGTNIPCFSPLSTGQQQTDSTQRENAQSFNSYQSVRKDKDSPFQQQHQQQQQPPPSYPPGFHLHPVYSSFPEQQRIQQSSDMQATAQAFVPQRSRSSTPHSTTTQLSHYLQQQQAPWNASLENDNRQHGQGHFTYGSNNSTNVPTMNFGYSAQPLPNFDPRSSISSPLSFGVAWQPPAQHPSQTVEQNAFMQNSFSPSPPPHAVPRSDSALSQQTKTSSPHPSFSSTEYSTAQRGWVKKDASSKRKPRGNKKKTAPAKQVETFTFSALSKKITSVPKRKASKGELSCPGSTAISQDGMEEHQVEATTDDAVFTVDPRQSELVESPSIRTAFKEFYRTFRDHERVSTQQAEDFAFDVIKNESQLPESVHWRVYLELADLAKRSNRYAEARVLYRKVCHLQPYATQGWLEYSKLEEECGRMNSVMNILYKGLEYCQLNENLLNRAVKHQEKLGNLDNARGILARLKHVGIEKVWRTVLEGALLEARAGNIATARRVLKYLMHHVPWYGPLYLEAYRLEMDQGHLIDALYVVERGLQAIPRYGPLWFGAFRLCEQQDISKDLYDMPSTINMVERATVNISKELVWKVHLEAAQILERAAIKQGSLSDLPFDSFLDPARRRFATTILTCPNNLRWKVWLAAARMELGVGDMGSARSLFYRAHRIAPEKGRSTTLLECARLEDFVGDTDLARAILSKGRVEYGNDWKVWLESVLLEIRCGQVLRALQLCDMALETHQGTGRLWATLVQLRQFHGRDASQLITLKRALVVVPKSGEVWCEGGRIHLNPFSDTFDLGMARRHLSFATRFTPQYGDGFVETIRLEVIEQWLAPIASYIWDETKHAFQDGRADVESGLVEYIMNVTFAISFALQMQQEQVGTKWNSPRLPHQNIIAHVRQQLQPDSLRSTADLNNLCLSCVNADPNYGLLWFHCRRKVTDTPRRIMEDAAEAIALEVQAYAHLYLAAMIRRKAILSTILTKKSHDNVDFALERTDPGVVEWEEYVFTKLHQAPSLVHMFNPTDPTTGMGLLENTVSGPLFSTGLSELNRHQPLQNLSTSDRKKVLFGNESLFP